MADLKFGWHMHSFPVDGSSGPAFTAQIHRTLDRVHPYFDSVWVDDHMIPWGAWQSKDTPFLECLTTIAYFAAAYPTLKFGASVLCQSFRNPGLLAKMAANLQLLTGGRFLFGIGAGWLEEEYRTYNFDFPTESPASFEGTYYRIEKAYCEPRPDPVPPILIGGGGEQLTLRVVARYADWWNFPGGSYDNYAHKLNVLRQHCQAVGRDYDEIVKSWSAEAVAVAETEAEAQRIAEASPYRNNPIVGTPDKVAEQLQAFIDLGIECLIVRLLDFPETAGIELFVREVMPRLTAHSA